MKSKSSHLTLPSLTGLFALLLTRPMHAQFTVFDPTNYANAVQEFHELQQTYTTAIETRDEVIAVYNLAYQMSQMPQDLAARYEADFAQWTSLSPTPNTYGNTAALINALNLGGPVLAQRGYNDAFVQAQNYPSASYSSSDGITQATIANQYATSELAQTTTTGTLSTLGTIRSDSQTFASQLANLESDTFSTDPTQQTENALLGKINTATLLQIHSQQDTNQILAASVQQQLINQKQQIDTENRALNEAIYFDQAFPNVMQQVTGGVSDSIHAISLSTTGQ